jgi:mannose-6-phosphate isomerase-like protein (cupin superfamily)
LPSSLASSHTDPTRRGTNAETSQQNRREGFEVIHGGQSANFVEDMHAHGFDVRIMVLSGEITVNRDGGSVTFRAGDHCEIPGDCQHTTKVGPEGVAYIVGKVDRRVAAN